MSDISKSSLGESFDAEFEKVVANCSTAAEISELMKSRSVSMGLVKRDIYSPDVLIPVDHPVAQKVGKVVVLNGVKHFLIAENDADLLAQETQLYREALGQPAGTTEQPRDERGQFVPDPTADVTTRIESDLVTRALEAQGIDPEALREYSAEKQQQQWATAVETFKAQHPDWQGGEANKNLIGNLIIENSDAFVGLSPLESLEKAYQHAAASGWLSKNPELVQRDRINSANSLEEIRAALGRSSGLFGGR